MPVALNPEVKVSKVEYFHYCITLSPVEVVQKPSLRDHSDGVGRRSNLGGGLSLSTQIATGFALAMTGWTFSDSLRIIREGLRPS